MSDTTRPPKATPPNVPKGKAPHAHRLRVYREQFQQSPVETHVRSRVISPHTVTAVARLAARALFPWALAQRATHPASSGNAGALGMLRRCSAKASTSSRAAASDASRALAPAQERASHRRAVHSHADCRGARARPRYRQPAVRLIPAGDESSIAGERICGRPMAPPPRTASVHHRSNK